MISGKNLRELIKNAGYTQDEFAKLVGKSRATVITWLGKGSIDQDVLDLISRKTDIVINIDQSKSTSNNKEVELLNEIISDLRERVEELKQDKARLQERLDHFESKGKSHSA